MQFLLDWGIAIGLVVFGTDWIRNIEEEEFAF